MSNKRSGSTYLEPAPEKISGPRTSPSFALLSGVLAFTLLSLLMVVGLASGSNPEKLNTQASAGSLPFLCETDLGTSMSSGTGGSLVTWYKFADNPNRIFTLDEIADGAIAFSSYNGEGEGGFLAREVNEERITKAREGRDLVLDEEQLQKMKDRRTGANCALSPLGAGVGSLLLGVAYAVSDISSEFTSFAFSTNLICPEPGASTNTLTCIDLLGTIGGWPDANGQPGETGIIGALTDSLYLPLLSLIGIAAGIAIAWKGIVKRQYRDALFQFIWVVSSVVLGLIFLLNPWILAKAPMSISNTISGCIVLSFNGDSCASDSTPTGSTAGADEFGKVCSADADGIGPNEALELVSMNLSCAVWKAFVLEPYAQGSFGQSYDDLDTKDPGPLLKSILKEQPPEYSDKFCFSTKAARPVDQQLAAAGTSGMLELAPPTSHKICNLAAYQLFLKSNSGTFNTGSGVPYTGAGAENLNFDGTGSGTDYENVDARWYNIIDVASQNDTMWDVWNGGVGRKMSVGFVALIASIFGAIVLVLVSITAIMYYFSSVFLMAFAPMFFLIGVHPGRGRDILKGYGEIILSNILKYIASSLFLVVTLAVYGSVLGNSSNLFVSLLFILVLSAGLLLYRKEIIELLGKVDMGGKKLSNKMSKFGSELGRSGMAVTGSAVGAKIKGESLTSGLREGARRELRAGRLPGAGQGLKSLTRNVAQTAQDVEQRNRSKASSDGSQLASESKELKDKVKADTTELGTLAQKHEESITGLEELKAQIEALREAAAGLTQGAVLAKMEDRDADGAAFVEAARLSHDIDSLDREIEVAQDEGRSDEEISALTNSRQELGSARLEIYRDLNDRGVLQDLTKEYNNSLAEGEEKLAEVATLEVQYEERQAETDKIAENIAGLKDSIVRQSGESKEKLEESRALKDEGHREFGRSSSTRKIQSRLDAGEAERAKKAQAAATDAANELANRDDLQIKPTESIERTKIEAPTPKMDEFNPNDLQGSLVDGPLNPPKIAPYREPIQDDSGAKESRLPTIGSRDADQPLPGLASLPDLPKIDEANKLVEEAKQRSQNLAARARIEAEKAQNDQLAEMRQKIEAEGAEKVIAEQRQAAETLKSKRDQAIQEFRAATKDSDAYARAAAESGSDVNSAEIMKGLQAQAEEARKIAEEKISQIDRDTTKAAQDLAVAMDAKYAQQAQEYAREVETKIKEQGAEAVLRAEQESLATLKSEEAQVRAKIDQIQADQADKQSRYSAENSGTEKKNLANAIEDAKNEKARLDEALREVTEAQTRVSRATRQAKNEPIEDLGIQQPTLPDLSVRRPSTPAPESSSNPQPDLFGDE